MVKELIFNENLLLMTMGFDTATEHPHAHVVSGCKMING